MEGPRDISVLLSTYNRADEVRTTLESFCRQELGDVRVEYVVVDNNSTDGTRSVVSKLSDRLPVRYLFEKRPGKNCALNFALDSVELGDIMAVTCCPALSAGTLMVKAPFKSAVPFPAEFPSTKTSTLAPAIPVPVTVVLPSITGGMSFGVGGRACTMTGAEGRLWSPFSVCLARTTDPA